MKSLLRILTIKSLKAAEKLCIDKTYPLTFGAEDGATEIQCVYVARTGEFYAAGYSESETFLDLSFETGAKRALYLEFDSDGVIQNSFFFGATDPDFTS